jgi:hypothetical protein
VVEYHGVGIVPLTLVDLPGLMAGGMVETDKEAVYDIVKYFAAQENTIVVSVSKSTDDGANDPSFNLIRLHHPKQDWICVHSKLDLLEVQPSLACPSCLSTLRVHLILVVSVPYLSPAQSKACSCVALSEA